MYLISTPALAEQFSVQDYKTAQVVARSLCLQLNQAVRIYELVQKLDGSPELLLVCNYTPVREVDTK